jgi:hypothetical protein
MKITWMIEDGYVGASRYQHLEIPDEDMEDMDDEAKEKYIEEYIQNDFNDKISWSYKIIK